jgi:hypothetical protein
VNYNLLSSLWQENGWIDGATASYAATHYGAYAYTTPRGFKFISINTDFWCVDNIYNFYVSSIFSSLNPEFYESRQLWRIGLFDFRVGGFREGGPEG